MVYDFGSLTENNYSGICDSTRSISSSEAEFEIEDRPALIQKKKRLDGMSTSLRGRPRSTTRDVMSISLRDRPRSTSATRRITAAIAKITEKEKKDVVSGDVGVALLDYDDDEGDISVSNNANEKTETADLDNTRKGLSHRKCQSSVQRTTEKESISSRPQVLRAPSFVTIDDPSENVIVRTMVSSIGNPNKENTPTPSKRIWSQRLVKQSNSGVQNVTDAPPSPSLRTSPPRSPRRFRTKDNIVAISTIPPLDSLAKDSDVPVFPSAETSRCSSPLKTFGQRAMGGILRNRKKTADDNSDPTLEVAEDLITITTSSSHVPPMSPTKRAIAGILRVCSLHDRSSPVKTTSSHERTKIASSTNKNDRLNSGDPVVKSSDEETNSKQLNTGELTRSETAIPSNSERGTRSSARVTEIDNESSYSRAVKSLVSPRQKAKRRLRAPSTRDADKDVKNRAARPRRRSENGGTSSSTRPRSISTGGASLSSLAQKQERRLSNGNSVVSKRDESSQCTESKSGGRTRSQSRTRRFSSHGTKSQTRESSQEENSTVQKHRETGTRRSSSRRNISTAAAELPRTPRSSRSEQEDARKSTSRSSSRRNVSELQIPFSEDPKTPQSSKSGIQAESGQSLTRSSSRGRISTVHDPKTPELRSSKGKVDGIENIKRSSSRRSVSEIQAQVIEQPIAALSSRSRDRGSSHNKNSHHSRSRSSCPAASSEKKSIRRVNSTRHALATDTGGPSTDEKSSTRDRTTTASTERSNSRVTKRVGGSVATKSPRRIRAADDDNPPSSALEPRRSSRQHSNITDSVHDAKKEKTEAGFEEINWEGETTAKHPLRRHGSKSTSISTNRESKNDSE